jgi:NADH-quinone oxidoreductase subunit H
LATTLFLGGWSLPWLSPAQQDGRLGLELAGGAWLVTKTGLVSLILTLLQEAAPGPALAEGSRHATRRGIPLAILALAATALWLRWSPEGSAQVIVSASLVVATALVAVTIVRRLRHGVFSAGADGHLSPFL